MSRRKDFTKYIGAKDLGSTALKEFCPRCFWIKRNLRKPPGVFPGIFSTLDKASKDATHLAYEKEGRVPDWMPFENVQKVEKGSLHFNGCLGSWKVTGKPDDVLRMEDGSYHIIDYKTAKYTERQDHLLPLYEIQLNVYALLLEQDYIKPISGMSLVYCDPRSALDNYDEFKLTFDIHRLDVEIDKDKVYKALKIARKITDLPVPPDGRQGCKKLCLWLDNTLKDERIYKEQKKV